MSDVQHKTTCVGCNATFRTSKDNTRSGWPLCAACLTGRHHKKSDDRARRLSNNDAYALA